MVKYILKNNIVNNNDNKKNIYYKYNEISNSVLEIKKSKFYSYIFNINSKESAEEILKKLRKDFYDAKHIVYVYITDNVIKYDEDSEPQYTATKKIQEHIINKNITNILVVIIRYFGGILLGAGPLSRAYFNVYLDAYKTLQLEEYRQYIQKEYILSYELYEKIKLKLEEYKKLNIIIEKNIIFTDKILIKIDIDSRYSKEIDNLFI